MPESYLEEIAMIDDTDINRLKEIFVTRHDCQSNVDHTKAFLERDNVRLAVIEQQNKLMLWILAAVAGGIITVLIKMFFGG